MKKFTIEWSGDDKPLIDTEKYKEKLSNTFSKNKIYMNLLKGSTVLNFLGGGGATFGGVMDLLSSLRYGGFASFEPFVVGIVLIGLGVLSRKSYMRLKNQQREMDLLRLMLINKGKVSVAEAAVKLNIPLDKIQQIIDNLHNKGHFIMDVADNGEMIYKLNQTTIVHENPEIKSLNA
jgi:predicted transcriptional regulator